MPNRNTKIVKKYEEKIEEERESTKNKYWDSEYSSVYGVCSYVATFLMMIVDAFEIENRISNFVKLIVIIIAIIVSCILNKRIKKAIENNKKTRHSDLTVNFGYMGFVLCAFSLLINVYQECWIKIFIIALSTILSIVGIMCPIKIDKLRNKKECTIKNI